MKKLGIVTSLFIFAIFFSATSVKAAEDYYYYEDEAGQIEFDEASEDVAAEPETKFIDNNDCDTPNNPEGCDEDNGEDGQEEGFLDDDEEDDSPTPSSQDPNHPDNWELGGDKLLSCSLNKGNSYTSPTWLGLGSLLLLGLWANRRQKA